MEFENTQVDGFEAAFRGARNPLNSWAKSDSYYGLVAKSDVYPTVQKIADTYPDSEQAYNFLSHNGEIKAGKNGLVFDVALIGYNDLSLAQRLLKAGVSDAKFMRQINVSVDITAPVFWLAELDTYKICTTRNSTSIQHKGMSRDYMPQDFTIDRIQLLPNNDDGVEVNSEKDLQIILDIVNKYRQFYKQTKDYKYFRLMREFMPMGYNYRITWSSNYAGLRNMYFQRRHHQLIEWREDFCNWVKSLPYGEALITYED